MKKLKKIVISMLLLCLTLTAIPWSEVTTAFAQTSTSATSDSTETQDTIEWKQNSSLLLGGTEGITRAEWLHNLAVMFDMTIEEDVLPDNYFTDLSEDSEYYKDILMNVEFGVVDIPAGGNVQPDELATREFIAQTLNFCLGFQLDGETEYTFSDSAEVEHADDAQIALNRGWFELVDSSFEPDTVVTKEELKVMIDDAASVLADSVIDEDYDSVYEFADDVKVVPEYLEVLKDEATITIKNSNVEVNEGQKFAVYFNGIPNVYLAESVTKENNDLVITYSDVELEEGFEDIDAQGVVAVDLSQIELAEGVEVVFMDGDNEESFPSTRAAIATYGADVVQFKNIYFKSSYDIGDGVSVSLNVTVKNPQVHYDVSALKGYASAYMTGNVDVSYSVKGDLAKAAGINKFEIFECKVPGVGGLDITITLDLSGKITGTQNFNMLMGISYDKSDGLRVRRNFEAKGYTISVQATASVALKVRFGITDLPIIDAYVYGEVGGIAQLTIDKYGDGKTPTQCTHFAAYLYAEVGIVCEIEFLGFSPEPIEETYVFFDENNSPIREVYHYEDGVQVAKCTRGKSYGYLTRRSSRYGSSGWYDGTATYAYDSEGNSIPLYTYELDEDNNATITGYNGLASVLVIPEILDGYKVVRIEQKVFEKNTRLISVTISDTVEAIGEYAFSECTNLSSVILSDSIVEIGGSAFNECDSLKNILIPKSLLRTTTVYRGGYEYGVFYGCDNLKNVIIEDGMTVLPNGLFAKCYGLEEIEIPDSVTEIGECAFSNCTNLYSVKLPKYVKKIENQAFENCDKIKSIWIPKSLAETTSFYNDSKGFIYGIFYECDGLKNVIFEDGITEIPYGLFSYCYGLESIEIPDSVTYIGEHAFGHCKNLSSVKLSKNVTRIDNEAFRECDKIESIWIPKSLCDTSKFYEDGYRYGIFYKCDGLKNVSFEDGITEIPYGLFSYCYGLESIEIPDSVTYIGEHAFSYCENLSSVKLSKNVTRIDNEAFRECDKIESIWIPKSLCDTSEFYEDGYRYGIFYKCDGLKSVSFEDGITKIPYGLMSGCYGLENVEIPESVKYIEEEAFMDCTNLYKVLLPNTLQTIEARAFMNCTNLYEVVLPNTLQTIEDAVFKGCENLEDFIIPDSTLELGEQIFRDCTKLSNIDLPEGLMVIPESMFMNCISLQSIELSKKIEKIGDSAFEVSGLLDVTIPEKVEQIGNNAFKNAGLITVNIENSKTSIGEYAFGNCNALTSVNLGCNIISINNYAFENCDQLKTISIPNSVSFLGKRIFYDCDQLANVVLGTGITEIRESSFEHCDNLTNITLPYRTKSIEKNVFKDCTKFVSITIPRNTTSIDSTAFSYPGNLTIYGIAGTYAEIFANKNNISFVNQINEATQANLNYKDISINNGSCFVLELSVVPASFTDEVVWKTTNADIVTVDENGTVIANGVGTTIIKVSVGNVSASCKVTVVQPVTGIRLNKYSLSMNALDTYQLTATVRPSNATNSNVTWKSSDETIATVDQTGNVTALKKGTATITVTATDGSNISNSCEVTVANSVYFVDSVEQLESPHNYENNCADYWVYVLNNAIELKVTFDDRTSVEEGFDYIYIFDGNDEQIGQYTGSELAGKTIVVTGDTVKIQLVSDTGSNEWGFKVSQIEEYTEDEKAVDMLIECIESLPSVEELQLTDKEALEEIRATYDAMSDEQKELIHNLDVLEAAEQRIVELEEIAKKEEADENAAKVVSDEINSLPTVDRLTLSDKDKVESARIAYESLTADQKVLVLNLSTLEEAENRIIELEESLSKDEENAIIAKEVSDMIVALPSKQVLTLADKEVVEAAREAYEALTEDQKALVTNLTELEVLEAKIVELEEAAKKAEEDAKVAKEVSDAIVELPTVDTITLENKAKVEAVREAYEALTEDQKVLVTNLAELEALEAKIAELEEVAEKAEEDAKAAKEVRDAIVELPTANTITLEDKAKVEAARKAYEALTEDQKALVTNLADLEALETKIIELEEAVAKSEEDTKAAKEVSDIIAELPTVDKITLGNKTEVEAARKAYEALTEEQKELVKNLSVLESIEERINELESQPIEPVNPFTDVKESDYFFKPVLWAVENGVTAGLSPTVFGPNEACTRAQVVTFLWRALGRPEPTIAEASFKDVPKNAYYYKAVLWAVENNITSGYNSETFGAEDIVTRSQFVTFLWRSKGRPEPISLETEFTDISKNAYYYKAVLWAVENGVTAGYYGTLFAPDISCTRGQVVSFLYRAK